MTRAHTTAARLAGAAVGTTLFVGVVRAHTGALSATQEPVSVPFWLFALTGGGVVAASFLFTSLVTDREFIDAVRDRRRTLPAGLPSAAISKVARGAAVAALVGVVVAGLFGPQAALSNPGLLTVWVGWWAGYTMSVYLIGDSWELLNPWRTLASWLPRLDRAYPGRLGAWPAVAGLLGLVWLEVISPLTESPRLLSGAILAYTAVTLAGAAAYGSGTWFSTVDPVARVFRYYGKIAPLGRSEGGLELRPPGATLRGTRPVGGTDEVAFVIAILWVTTYDGLIATPTWAGVARAAVGAGVPPRAFYALTLVAGFSAFFGVYRVASRLVRRTAGSYVAAATIERRFATSLLPIAAGYHLAHFLGYFLTLAPAWLGALANPLGTGRAVVLTLPGWFGGVALGFVIVGHLVAVWIAHGIAFDLFAGRLQPIRGQYPFIAVMVAYTMTSLWIVAQPYTAPPFV